jgi:hypothetical protein
MMSLMSALGDMIRKMGRFSDKMKETEVKQIVNELQKDETLLKKSIRDVKNCTEELIDIDPNIGKTQFRTNSDRTKNIINVLRALTTTKSDKQIPDATYVANLLDIVDGDKDRFMESYNKIATKSSKPRDSLMGWIITVMFNYLKSQWYNILMLICIFWVFNMLWEITNFVRNKLSDLLRTKKSRKGTMAILFNMFHIDE